MDAVDSTSAMPALDNSHSGCDSLALSVHLSESKVGRHASRKSLSEHLFRSMLDVS